MATSDITKSLEVTLSRFVDMFLADEPVAFIATEMLVSSDISRNMEPGTKFAALYAEAESSIPKQGFDWWSPPQRFAACLEYTRHEIRKSESREAAMRVLYRLLTEQDPGFLSKVAVPST